MDRHLTGAEAAEEEEEEDTSRVKSCATIAFPAISNPL